MIQWERSVGLKLLKLFYKYNFESVLAWLYREHTVVAQQYSEHKYSETRL